MRTSTYFNRYTLLIGILLAVVVLSPGPGATRAGQSLHDFAHAPVFALITFLCLLASVGHRAERSFISHLTWAFACGVTLGVATELVQKFTGGDASWRDLQSDVIGTVVGCGLFAAVGRVIAPRVRLFTAIAAMAILTLHSLPYVGVARAYVRRNQEFPTLFDASAPRPDRFISTTDAVFSYGSLPAALIDGASLASLHVKLSRGEWPGIAFEEPYPDWSGYRHLNLDLTNPSEEPLEIFVRVLDETHDWRSEDRFTRPVTLEPRRRIVVAIALADIERSPRGRRLDLRAISDLRLFTVSAQSERELYVTRVWLD